MMRYKKSCELSLSLPQLRWVIIDQCVCELHWWNGKGVVCLSECDQLFDSTMISPRASLVSSTAGAWVELGWTPSELPLLLLWHNCIRYSAVVVTDISYCDGGEGQVSYCTAAQTFNVAFFSNQPTSHNWSRYYEIMSMMKRKNYNILW